MHSNGKGPKVPKVSFALHTDTDTRAGFIFERGNLVAVECTVLDGKNEFGMGRDLVCDVQVVR